MLNGPFSYSILKKAQNKKYIDIRFINIRDFSNDKYQSVDDHPYGGGPGMIIRVDILHRAIMHARCKKKCHERIILLDPKGKTFDQFTAKKMSTYDHLILVCGHYEGVDERIKKYIDESISIGNYILTGGEIPAMVVTDAVSRLVDGVLNEESTKIESIPSLYYEYPQYTKPQIFKNQKVPSVLLSGNHQKIKKWRSAKSNKSTISG